MNGAFARLAEVDIEYDGTKLRADAVERDQADKSGRTREAGSLCSDPPMDHQHVRKATQSI